MPAAAQTVGTYATGISSANDHAWDSSGNLYVSGINGEVHKVAPGGSPVTVFASGFNQPFGLAFGPSGDLFVSDRGAPGNIWRVAANGSSKVFVSGLTDPTYMHFDGSGNLFVAEVNGQRMQKLLRKTRDTPARP